MTIDIALFELLPLLLYGINGVTNTWPAGNHPAEVAEALGPVPLLDAGGCVQDEPQSSVQACDKVAGSFLQHWTWTVRGAVEGQCHALLDVALSRFDDILQLATDLHPLVLKMLDVEDSNSPS